jgi:hypothetical protein
MWIYTSTAPYAFMAQCLISYAQGQLCLYLFILWQNDRNLGIILKFCLINFLQTYCLRGDQQIVKLLLLFKHREVRQT